MEMFFGKGGGISQDCEDKKVYGCHAYEEIYLFGIEYSLEKTGKRLVQDCSGEGES